MSREFIHRDLVWTTARLADGLAAVADTKALGTSVRVAVWPPENLEEVVKAVGVEIRRLDLQASRFRPDSEISLVHASGGGVFLISQGLAEAIGVALAAARFTRGLVDPTVGEALQELGYDRDFATIDSDDQAASVTARPVPGHACVSLEGRLLRLPSGVVLDLGATAKGLGSDRCVRAAASVSKGLSGVLVSLGGDVAVGGEPPATGWPVEVTELPDGHTAASQVVRLFAGGIATSTTTMRCWRRGGRVMHHIIDPATGLPAEGIWRTASVAAATCAEANAAATAVLVAGDDAVEWLEEVGLPARLVDQTGAITYVGPWPETDGAPVLVPRQRMRTPPVRGHSVGGIRTMATAP